MHYRLVDQAQYQLRIKQRDFDMVERVLPQTFSPDAELRGYFHSAGMDDSGTLNLAGVNHPAVDYLTEKIPTAQTRSELETLTKALDRLLILNYYGIIRWRAYTVKVAYRDIFAWPENLPKYATSFRTWWHKE